MSLLGVDFAFISGVQIGVEWIDGEDETVGLPDLSFLYVNLLIISVLFTFGK